MPFIDPATGREYPDDVVENRSERALAKMVAEDRAVDDVVDSLEVTNASP